MMDSANRVSARPQWLGVLALLRPQQWVKNLFIFVPLFFDGRIAEV